MGYSTKKHAYGESRCFWPDDTDTGCIANGKVSRLQKFVNVLSLNGCLQSLERSK